MLCLRVFSDHGPNRISVPKQPILVSAAQGEALRQEEGRTAFVPPVRVDQCLAPTPVATGAPAGHKGYR